MPHRILITILTCIAVLDINSVVARTSLAGYMDSLLAQKKYTQVERIATTSIDSLFRLKQLDSIPGYTYYLGKAAMELKGVNAGVAKVQSLLNRIKGLKPSARVLKDAYYEASYFYGLIDKNELAYATLTEAYKYAMRDPRRKAEEMARMDGHLGTYAQRLGNLSLSGMHHRRAMKGYSSEQKPNYESLFVSYNNMGSIMWYSSKLDSAMYYFELGLKALAKTPQTAENKYWRRAIIENNISGLYGLQGKTTESIQALRNCIKNLRSFMASNEPNPKKATAVSFQYEAIDNLGGIYKELGDLKQAHELLQYSYRGKLKDLKPDNPAIATSEILLGSLYFSMREYNKSREYLVKGVKGLEAAEGDLLYLQADGYKTLALMSNKLGRNIEAAQYFEKADSLYEETFQGSYDDIYLDFLKNSSLFYAEAGNTNQALVKARKGYDYVVKNHGGKTLLAFYHLLNLSEVSYLSGKYAEALDYSKKGLEVVNENIRSSTNMLDSVKMEINKPKAILLKTKAEYALLKKKDKQHVSGLLKGLSEALALLERRKLVIGDAENVTRLMADHKDLLEFAKKLTVDLYSFTKDLGYIDQLISLQESGIYNRIRSRLDKNDSVTFTKVSAETQATERRLKAAISNSLQGDRTHDEKLQAHFASVEKWNKFLQKLRLEHPEYYRMRYGSIFKSSAEVQASIPENTSVVRYLIIEKELYALVIDNTSKEIYRLEHEGLEENIKGLSQYTLTEPQVAEVLHKLYGQLWAPLEKDIHSKSVIIIPDGILFNLSFEMLTPKKIASYREFVTGSLVAKYAISYQYSLFLLQHSPEKRALKEKFVAFAPGFSDNLKSAYKRVVSDSMDLDHNYLHLLPQPFSVNLARNTIGMLGGSLFVEKESTEATFKKRAGRHEIIHIGTHAESDNQHPEFSRLIFARDPDQPGEDNSLYLPEIYNCDLTSNLTVLTACETGKPGYEDGEGMISLAHAFNFAGSESILMGLWKIDEKSSATIVASFYKNLLAGLSKDEALRQAKLSYLQTARGSALDPAYWAGLVLMGNSQPIELKQVSNNGYWLAGSIVIAGIGVMAGGRRLLKRRQKQL